MTERAQRPPYTSLAILAVIALAIFVWIHADRDGQADKRSSSLPNPGGAFEKFGTLTDISFLAEGGRELRLSDFRGTPVVLNLWATWCGPCVEEMPSLDRLQRDYPGVAVVAVSLDKQGEEKVRSFYGESGLTHLKIYADPTMKSMTALGVPGLPATILIASDGSEAGGVNGAYDWDSAEARAAIADLVKSGGSAGPDRQFNVKQRLLTPRPDGITAASFGK